MENINSKFKIQNSKLVKWFALKSEAMKGFTLVELLVVIGVLGILAAGLLATIDPLEQFRKGTDSNNKTAALELTNALTRYYATKNVMPWATVANGGAGCNGAAAPAAVQADVAAFADCLTALVTQGELKSTFSSQTSILKALKVSDKTVGTAVSAAVCYAPTSKSEQLRTETKYNNDATVNAACPATGGTCYWCAQ